MRLLTTAYRAAYAFRADIVVVRLGENARFPEDLREFETCYREMTDLFAANGAKIVLTDLFWEYETFDNFVRELAQENGYVFAQLHDLGRSDGMKAIGKFSHASVAAHLGDRGMEEIAERIFRAIKENFDRIF